MAKAAQPAVLTDEILFELERFELEGGQLRVIGRWFGVRGRRFVRPTLTPLSGRDLSRVLADLEHKPWAAEDGELWEAAFPWNRNGAAVKFELSVAPDIVIQLPSPRANLALPRRLAALPRQPTIETSWRAPQPEVIEGRGVEIEPTLDTTADELEAAKQQLAVLREELASAAAAREAAASQAAAAVIERNQLRTERDELEAERDELRAAQAQLSATDTELRAMETELEAANADLNALVEELRRERDQLLADVAAGQRQVDELRSELERTTSVVQTATRERDEAIASHGAAMVMRRATLAEPYHSRHHYPWRAALAVIALLAVAVAILIVVHAL